MDFTNDEAGRAGRESRVVVVGAGFAGVEAARALGRAGVPVTLVDRQNHHLFQPLIYQVATAALAAPDVAEPVRKMVRGLDSVQVLQAEVEGIDTAARRVLLDGGEELAYDWLILASGATHSWFGHDEWSRHARGLKTLEDAGAIRASVLAAFEMAERTRDEAQRRRLMTIAVIGGGPTGVEMAGSLAELCRYTLARDFRAITPAAARIMLIEAGPRLLAGFSQEGSEYARKRLERLGVEVLTDAPVEEIAAGRLRAGGELVEAGNIVWAAGVAASPLAAALGVETDRAGRVSVAPDLTVPGVVNVMALGDMALLADADGRPLPGLAQVAKQQGRHAGRSLGRLLQEGEPLPAFRYRHRGSTAIVGRHAAIFEQGRFRLTGWIAWLAWAIIHVYLLSGSEQRVLVSIQWLWRYLTYERGARVFSVGHRRPEPLEEIPEVSDATPR